LDFLVVNKWALNPEEDEKAWIRQERRKALMAKPRRSYMELPSEEEMEDPVEWQDPNVYSE
jgi:hypothetical protein